MITIRGIHQVFKLFQAMYGFGVELPNQYQVPHLKPQQQLQTSLGNAMTAGLRLRIIHYDEGCVTY